MKDWTKNYNLTVKRESDGEVKNLLVNGEFQNLDWLAQQVGGSNSWTFINLNDDLHDGPEANGETFRHNVYKWGECVETFTFEYIKRN